MRVAQKIAGYSLEEADNLRKACGKKIRALLAAEREKFIAGCVSEGYDEELGTQLFDIIEPFADYAFNKSHAYGYGLVAYQTAWLKAHHPVEYMAALLTSVKDNKDKTAVYLAECRSLGIEVLVPDVNRSVAEFAADISLTGPDPTGLPASTGNRAIIFGLASVRNVGEGLVERIVAERTANGPFADIYDFCQRVDPLVLNKRTVESLIKAGACSTPSDTPARVSASSSRRSWTAPSSAGVSTTSGSQRCSRPSRPRTRIPVGARRRWTYPRPSSTRHSASSSRRRCWGSTSATTRSGDSRPPSPGTPTAPLSDMREEDPTGDRSPRSAAVGGVVTDLRRSYTKKGDLMAPFVLEDLQAAMEVFVFPKTMADYGPSSRTTRCWS